MFAYDHNHVAVLVCGRFGRNSDRLPLPEMPLLSARPAVTSATLKCHYGRHSSLMSLRWRDAILRFITVRSNSKSVFSFRCRCKHDTARICCWAPCCCGRGSKGGRACCRRAVQQSIDIACPPGPQQQTRRTPRLPRNVTQTDRQTPHRKRLSEMYKKLSYRRGTARCVVSVEILTIATQKCRNYLYDKSWTKYQLSRCR